MPSSPKFHTNPLLASVKCCRCGAGGAAVKTYYGPDGQFRCEADHRATMAALVSGPGYGHGGPGYVAGAR